LADIKNRAHPACKCITDQQYCSNYCRNAGDEVARMDQYSEPPQLWKSHQPSEQRPVRPLNHHLSERFGRGWGERRLQSAVSDRRTALDPIGSQAPILSAISEHWVPEPPKLGAVRRTVVNEAWRPPAEGREIHCRHCRVCSLYTQSDVLPSHEKNIVITTHGSFFKGH